MGSPREVRMEWHAGPPPLARSRYGVCTNGRIGSASEAVCDRARRGPGLGERGKQGAGRVLTPPVCISASAAAALSCRTEHRRSELGCSEVGNQLEASKAIMQLSKPDPLPPP